MAMKFFSPDFHMAFFYQIGVLFFALLFFIVFYKKKIALHKSKLFYLLCMFVFYALISVLWAHNKYESFFLIPSLLTCLLIFIIIQNSIDTKNDIYLILFLFFKWLICFTAWNCSIFI